MCEVKCSQMVQPARTGKAAAPCHIRNRQALSRDPYWLPVDFKATNKLALQQSLTHWLPGWSTGSSSSPAPPPARPFRPCMPLTAPCPGPAPSGLPHARAQGGVGGQTEGIPLQASEHAAGVDTRGKGLGSRQPVALYLPLSPTLAGGTTDGAQSRQAGWPAGRQASRQAGSGSHLRR